MKPLDLTKPVQYRYGKEARILTTKGRYTLSDKHHQPIVSEDDNGVIHCHDVDGYYNKSSGEGPLDLINVPEKRTVEFWVNVFSDDSANFAHSSKEKADKAALYLGSLRIACLHIVKEFTVGDGL